MAQEKGSEKIFGGTSVPAGSYIINRAFVGDAVLRIDGQDPKPYETLELELLHIKQDGTPGDVCLTTHKLNGCWRPRTDKNGNIVRHSGSFIDALMRGFAGKSFADTARGITASLRGYIITIGYTEYPTAVGVGHVSKVELGQKVANMPALQQPVAPQQAPQQAPQGAPVDNNPLPF